MTTATPTAVASWEVVTALPSTSRAASCAAGEVVAGNRTRAVTATLAAETSKMTSSALTPKNLAATAARKAAASKASTVVSRV